MCYAHGYYYIQHGNASHVYYYVQHDGNAFHAPDVIDYVVCFACILFVVASQRITRLVICDSGRIFEIGDIFRGFGMVFVSEIIVNNGDKWYDICSTNGMIFDLKSGLIWHGCCVYNSCGNWYYFC